VRNEADGAFTTLAVSVDALTLDLLKERPLLWPVDVPEAEIILVDAHLNAPMIVAGAIITGVALRLAAMILAIALRLLNVRNPLGLLGDVRFAVALSEGIRSSISETRN
jgi:hypothetical protein